MSYSFKDYLLEAYLPHQAGSPLKGYAKNTSFIQIDDQDDTDNIENFCNIFINFNLDGSMELELIGKIPLNDEFIDFIDIYQGTISRENESIRLILKSHHIDIMNALITHIKKSASSGEKVGNPLWYEISARTAQSLSRFLRILKGYQSLKEKALV